MQTRLAALLLVIALVSLVRADNGPASRPGAQPPTSSGAQPGAQQLTPEQMLNQMLKAPAPTAKPLQSADEKPALDRATGKGAVAPNAPSMPVLREGSFIVDRIARLTHSADGAQAELSFESDGKAMKDPPMVLLPNQNLQRMEDSVKGLNRDLKFRVTGMITEYRGRNYVLLEKVMIVSDNVQQF